MSAHIIEISSEETCDVEGIFLRRIFWEENFSKGPILFSTQF